MSRFPDSPRMGDWMKLRCGDRVRERDGRHIGRVEAIHHGAFVVVRWLDNGWFSELPLGDVERWRFGD